MESDVIDNCVCSLLIPSPWKMNWTGGKEISFSLGIAENLEP